MATSGSFNTSSVGSFYFTFEWSRTSYDSSANEHYIHYKVKAHNAAGQYRTVYLKRLVINNNQVFYEEGKQSSGKTYYDDDIVTEGDITIHSSNDAGDGSIFATFEAGVGIYSGSNCNGNGSWDLDRIPRTLSSINLYDNGSTLESISARWTCDPARDWTQYSLNGGTWTDAGDTVASDNKSGYFIINNLQPGTEYSLKIRLRRTDSSLWSESNTINIRTLNNAIINNFGDNFNIFSNQALTVRCDNPSNSDILYYLDCPTGTRRFASERTKNTSYTWTQEQILSLLQYTPDSNTISIKIGITTYGISEYDNNKIGTLNVVDSNPIFSNFTYADINEDTLALTGNNQILIKGYSSSEANISITNRAIKQNYAIMDRYEFAQGSKRISKPYSLIVSLALNNIDSNVMTVTAIDSRGNSTKVTKTLDNNLYKNYSGPIISSLIATRDNFGVSESVTLSFNGTFWNENFGSVTNTIKSVKYQYKESNSNTWSAEQSLTFVTNGSTYFGSQNISGDLGAQGFDVSKSFNIRLIVKDELEEKTAETSIGYGEPAIAIYKGNIAIGQKYNTTLGGRLQINGIGYINGIKIQPEIITANVDRKTLTISQAWDAINLTPFDSYISTTNKITVTNTGLKIGSNVSKILVSAHCRGLDCATFTGQNIFSVRKNNVVITEDYISSANGWHPFNITPLLINCTENDIISIYFTSSIAGTGDALEEYLTIQIIE